MVRAVVSCPPCCEADEVKIPLMRCRVSDEARGEDGQRQTYANLPKRAPVAQRPPVASKKAEAAPTARPYLLLEW